MGETSIDYMISFSLPRFCDQQLSRTRKQAHYAGQPNWIAKLDTIVHELYHIDPNGPGIRRMERADGTSWNLVFVPTTPNPTTGFLQLVPVERVSSAGISIEDGIKLVMSLGSLTPQDWNPPGERPVGSSEPQRHALL